MAAYYNEIDPYCAQWLRNLIDAGHIAPGEVDERSIVDVRADDLKGFVQCHFFAGIGAWSYALRIAGWSDDKQVWTGSCPCQSFSTAGKQKGFDDPRHLWPAWLRLIEECGPPTIFGEQVEAAIKHGWLDLVQTDLENSGYAFGAANMPAASVGAPHQRHRVWFVANSDDEHKRSTRQHEKRAGNVAGESETVWMAKAHSDRCKPGSTTTKSARHEDTANSNSGNDNGRPGPTNEFWRDADWLRCRDEKWRPVEPGTFPLADGAPARMGKIRAYGNAIVPQVAAEFIKAAI